MPSRNPFAPAPGVAQWLQPLRLLRSSEHLRISDRDLYHLAALLALGGSPGTPEGQKVFWAFKGLLLQPKRLSRLRSTLEAIPPEAEAVKKLAEVIHAYGKHGESISSEKIRTDRVVKVMLQISDPTSYLRHLKNRGFNHMGAIFHENTLERTRKELRGSFEGTEGENGYWERTLDQLNVITDE